MERFWKVRMTIALIMIPAASSALAEPLTLVEQKIFVKSCIADNDSMRPYCECTLTELQERMSPDEIRRMGNMGKNEMMNDEKFADAVAECADLIIPGSPIQAEQLAKVEQRVFLKSCIANDESMRPYCECTLTELQERMTPEEFRLMAGKSEKEMMDDERFSDAVVACSDKIPKKG